MLITPEQIRAARALLRLDQEELARRAQVSVVTVRRLEGNDGTSTVAPGTVDEIRRTLETAGAEFIENGVRRRVRSAEDIERRRQILLEISARGAAQQAKLPPFSEADLYNENGL